MPDVEKALLDIERALEEKGLSPQRFSGSIDVLRAYCRFNKERTPSFYIYRKNGSLYYKCFSCGRHGNLIQLLMELDLDPAQYGFSPHSFQRRRRGIETLINKFGDYMKKRLVIEDDSTLRDFVKRYEISAEKEKILFTLRSPDGTFRGFISHKPGEKYINPKGEREPYLLYESISFAEQNKKVNHLYVVEGVFDALAFHRVGLPAVAVLGAGVSRMLQKILNVDTFSVLILAFDNDETGKLFTREAIEYLLKRRLTESPAVPFVLKLPESVKDPNELLQKLGPEGFWGYVTNLTSNLLDPRIAYGLTFAEDLTRDLDRFRALKKAVRIYQETKDVKPLLDKYTEMLVGKVDFGALLQKYLAITEEEWIQAVTSLEEEVERELLERRFIEDLENLKKIDIQEALVELERVKREYERKVFHIEGPVTLAEERDALLKELAEEPVYKTLTWCDFFRFREGDTIVLKGETGKGKTTVALNVAYDLLEQGMNVIYVTYEIERKEIIRDLARLAFAFNGKVTLSILSDFIDTYGNQLTVLYGPSLPEIRAFVQRFKEKKGKVDLVIVDYDMWVDIPGHRFETTERKVDAISKGLKSIAVDYRTSVLILSQVNKEGEAKWGRVKEEDASLVISLQAEGEDKENEFWYVKLKVLKSRNGKYGEKEFAVRRLTRRISKPSNNEPNL